MIKLTKEEASNRRLAHHGGDVSSAFRLLPTFTKPEPTSLTQRRHMRSVEELGQCRGTWREQPQSYNCYLIHCRAAIQEAVKGFQD